MRKIEEKMCLAIAERRNWQLDNTRVSVGNESVTVLLYGHVIARLRANILTIYDAGYPTATTKSRLNAILRSFNGGGVYQENHSWYYWQPECGSTPFFSGMQVVT